MYGVGRAGFYAWRRRPASARHEQDRKLTAQIRAIFEASTGTYGSPRIHRTLRTQGVRVSRRRIERLMRHGNLRARVVRIYRANPRLHRFFGQHPNHVGRTRATTLNAIWVADLTYLAVGRRWWFLAVVLDQCSRRVLAWQLAATRDSRLTRAVINAALRRRQRPKGLIFHSDRGSEYLGAPLRRRLQTLGIRQSMTRGGSPGENAHMESFFHSLKADLIHGRQFHHVDHLRHALRRYIRYYNFTRLHSALDYQSPVDYERGAA